MNPSIFDEHGINTTFEEENGVNENFELTQPLTKPDRKKEVSFFGNVAIVFCSVTGAGILGIPYAVESVGWVTGFILLIFCGLVSQYGLYLIGEVFIHIKKEDPDAYVYFGQISAIINRKYFPLICDLLLFISLFTVCVMYAGITADFLKQGVTYFEIDFDKKDEKWYESRLFFLTIPYVLFSAPASYLESFKKLQYTSYLGAIFIFYVVLVVVVFSFKDSDYVCSSFLKNNNLDTCLDSFCCVNTDFNNNTYEKNKCCIGEVVLFVPSFLDIIYSLPIMITAFGCIGTALKGLNDLHKPTKKRFNSSTGISLIMKLVADLAIAICAIYTFGNKVDHNVLTNYPNNGVVTIARFAIGILVMLTFPLVFQPVRVSSTHAISHSYEIYHRGEQLSEYKKKVMYYVITTVLLIAIYIAAAQGLPITVLLNFAGVVSVGQLTFALPAYFYLKIIKPTNMWRRASCYFLIGYSFLLTVCNIYVWIKGGSSSH